MLLDQMPQTPSAATRTCLTTKIDECTLQKHHISPHQLGFQDIIKHLILCSKSRHMPRRHCRQILAPLSGRRLQQITKTHGIRFVAKTLVPFPEHHCSITKDRQSIQLRQFQPHSFISHPKSKCKSKICLRTQRPTTFQQALLSTLSASRCALCCSSMSCKSCYHSTAATTENEPRSSQ